MRPTVQFRWLPALLMATGLLATSTRAFAAPLFLPHTDYAAGLGTYAVAIGDMNGDGKPDLVTANVRVSTVSVLLGNGDGTFGPATDFNTGNSPVCVAVGDLNGDGKLDVATGAFGTYPTFDGSVSVLLGNGDGTLGPNTDFASGSPQGLTIGDVNGDGKRDVVTANYQQVTHQHNGYVIELRGNGDGTFGAQSGFGSGSIDAGTVAVAIGDVNGDGKPDLVAANAGGSTVSVLIGAGNGSFGASTDYVTGDTPVSVAIGDVNGDGNPDLVTADNSPAGVSVLLGSGLGTFGPHADYGTGINPRSVAIGDLDGDGKLDVVTANYTSSSTVSVLLGKRRRHLRAPDRLRNGDRAQLRGHR